MRGTVFNPTDEQNMQTFCETMPASMAPVSLALSLLPPNLDRSDTMTSDTGNLFTKSCPPATALRWSPSATSCSVCFAAMYLYAPFAVMTYTSISCLLSAEGAVRLPSAGRFTPFAAHTRSERSLRLISFPLQVLSDFLSFSAFITFVPLSVFGSGNLMSPAFCAPARTEMPSMNADKISFFIMIVC